MAENAVTGTAKRGLAPVLDPHVRVLILGSFPGEASLAAGQYYAHPRNQFWALVGALIDAPLPQLPYAQRLAAMLANGIGLWDVFVACERNGSLDAAIRNGKTASIARVRRGAPLITHVFFNGATAARALPAWRDAGYATLALPSSSPAYTQPFAEKLERWRAISDAVVRPAQRIVSQR
jgi:hypoxanthine-DNA glycosylase